MRKILCGQLIIVLILFSWCTKAWAPFPMVEMESGEIKVDMPKEEEILEEQTEKLVVEPKEQKKETEKPAMDISAPSFVEAETGISEGDVVIRETQAEHKTSATEKKFVEQETVRKKIDRAGEIKVSPLRQMIIDGAIIIFAVAILLIFIYLSRKGKI